MTTNETEIILEMEIKLPKILLRLHVLFLDGFLFNPLNIHKQSASAEGDLKFWIEPIILFAVLPQFRFTPFLHKLTCGMTTTMGRRRWTEVGSKEEDVDSVPCVELARWSMDGGRGKVIPAPLFFVIIVVFAGSSIAEAAPQERRISWTSGGGVTVIFQFR